MKLIIEDEKDVKTVRLCLFEITDGSILLQAMDETKAEKTLLRFFPSGKVVRCSCAQIGDFAFDEEGRIIIE